MKLALHSLAVLTLAALTLAAPVFAGAPHPPPHKRSNPNGTAGNWNEHKEDIDDALGDYEDAKNACSQATREYDHVAFGGNTFGGTGNARERLSSAKRSACDGKMGAETKIRRACNAAIKFLEHQTGAENDSRRKWVYDVANRHGGVTIDPKKQYHIKR
jgi:hypothetical protein